MLAVVVLCSGLVVAMWAAGLMVLGRAKRRAAQVGFPLWGLAGLAYLWMPGHFSPGEWARATGSVSSALQAVMVVLAVIVLAAALVAAAWRFGVLSRCTRLIDGAAHGADN